MSSARALALLVLLASPARAAAPQQHAFELPGRVVATAELAPAGLALATLDEAGTLALWRLDAGGGAPRLRPLADLPAELARVSGDERESPGVALATLEGTAGGEAALLVSRPGGLWQVGPGGTRRLLAEPGFALATPLAAGDTTPAPPVAWPLALARAGELLLLPAAGATPLRVPLPLEARPRAWGLELASPPVRRLAAPAGGTVVVVGPQRVGERRLRTLLLDAQGGLTEAWSQLPAGERLLAGRPLTLDGQLLLAVTAAPAGMLAEQRLHVFRLAGDRTRGGSGPLFSTQLQVRHWESPDLVTGDRDGDGREDLVVVEPRGLGGGQLTLSTLRGLGGGRLSSPSRRVGWDESFGARAYGADLTGDGRADLVRVGEKRLLLHAGAAGERPVNATAEWSVALDGTVRELRTLTVGAGAGADGSGGASVERGGEVPPDGGEADDDDGFGASSLAACDLDGDGVAEVLLWRRRDAGGSELRVLSRR